jgi:ankyrin repeat protein
LVGWFVGGHTKVIQLLAEHSADLNMKVGTHLSMYDTYTGYAPIHLACRNAHTGTLLELIAKGAQINLQDRVSICYLLFFIFVNRLQ